MTISNAEFKQMFRNEIRNEIRDILIGLNQFKNYIIFLSMFRWN